MNELLDTLKKAITKAVTLEIVRMVAAVESDQVYPQLDRCLRLALLVLHEPLHSLHNLFRPNDPPS